MSHVWCELITVAADAPYMLATTKGLQILTAHFAEVPLLGPIVVSKMNDENANLGNE